MSPGITRCHRAGDNHLLAAVTVAAQGQLAALAPQQLALLCWAVGRQGPAAAAASERMGLHWCGI
jgi:hypothetical protein